MDEGKRAEEKEEEEEVEKAEGEREGMDIYRVTEDPLACTTMVWEVH